MSKHTQGPWVKDKKGQLVGSNGKHVVVHSSGLATGPEDEETVANGVLVGAAPKLLAVLERVLQYVPIEDAELMWQTRSAIAEAKGE